MKKPSAGLLVYRDKNGQVEVFLVHPGGPFWAKKDLKAWSIPKGEIKDDATKLAEANREFSEETGQPPPGGAAHALGSIKQIGGKTVFAWAIKGDPDETNIKSNSFEVEWPPKSGHRQSFPEVDKAGWFNLTTAASKMHTGQEQLLSRLAEHLGLNFVLPPAGPGEKLSQPQTNLL